jgi:hypothetical protein
VRFDLESLAERSRLFPTAKPLVKYMKYSYLNLMEKREASERKVSLSGFIV